jgi:hypothetical protein
MSRRSVYDGDYMQTGYCAYCGNYCAAVKVDLGIGLNEFWGSVGNDIDIHWLSPCCEEDLLNSPPEDEEDE